MAVVQAGDGHAKRFPFLGLRPGGHRRSQENCEKEEGSHFKCKCTALPNQPALR
jgi:hypothetical protein